MTEFLLGLMISFFIVYIVVVAVLLIKLDIQRRMDEASMNLLKSIQEMLKHIFRIKKRDN
jgi:hypothetical protein